MQSHRASPFVRQELRSSEMYIFIKFAMTD